ncbi:predicted protein [Coccidioides posadasii str. Silveira]|uniref:Predicted protein n=1 Tax=Coccidioides posadasii (strain RMSCC 757 / Silveira) TaxID=443226 RepID=E9CRH9_COCPS|nr:predicted protein [Coccidioides posadasii str. Silveira]
MAGELCLGISSQRPTASESWGLWGDFAGIVPEFCPILTVKLLGSSLSLDRPRWPRQGGGGQSGAREQGPNVGGTGPDSEAGRGGLGDHRGIHEAEGPTCRWSHAGPAFHWGETKGSAGATTGCARWDPGQLEGDRSQQTAKTNHRGIQVMQPGESPGQLSG